MPARGLPGGPGLRPGLSGADADRQRQAHLDLSARLHLDRESIVELLGGEPGPQPEHHDGVRRHGGKDHCQRSADNGVERGAADCFAQLGRVQELLRDVAGQHRRRRRPARADGLAPPRLRHRPARAPPGAVRQAWHGRARAPPPHARGPPAGGSGARADHRRNAPAHHRRHCRAARAVAVVHAAIHDERARRASIGLDPVRDGLGAAREPRRQPGAASARRRTRSRPG